MSDSLLPMDYTVHGILQARMLEWVAFPFSRGSSQHRDWAQVSLIAGRFFTSLATRKPKNTGVGSRSLLLQIFLTQESNQGLLNCRRIPYQLSHQGRPTPVSRAIHVAANGIISFFFLWLSNMFNTQIQHILVNCVPSAILTCGSSDSPYVHAPYTCIHIRVCCFTASSQTFFLPIYIISIQFISVTQSCLTLWDPMNRNTSSIYFSHGFLKGFIR